MLLEHQISIVFHLNVFLLNTNLFLLNISVLYAPIAASLNQFGHSSFFGLLNLSGVATAEWSAQPIWHVFMPDALRVHWLVQPIWALLYISNLLCINGNISPSDGGTGTSGNDCRVREAGLAPLLSTILHPGAKQGDCNEARGALLGM